MSSVLKLAIVIFVAAIFAFIARTLLINSQQTQQTQAIPEIKVRIAAADLPTGLLLRDSDLAWQTILQNELPNQAITENNDNILEQGALLRQPIKAGQIITKSDFLSASAPGFLAAVLKPGMRAVSVEINDVSGNAGLIQPGDYVDMILSQTLNTGTGNRQIVSETVVERARIIAVGSSFKRDTDKSSANNRARTVTVEVQPRAAEAVIVASKLGSLSLALRSFATTDRNSNTASDNDGALVVAWQGEHQDEQTGPVWGSDVSKALENNTNSLKETTNTKAERNVTNNKSAPILIYRGNKASTVNQIEPIPFDMPAGAEQQ